MKPAVDCMQGQSTWTVNDLHICPLSRVPPLGNFPTLLDSHTPLYRCSRASRDFVGQRRQAPETRAFSTCYPAAILASGSTFSGSSAALPVRVANNREPGKAYRCAAQLVPHIQQQQSTKYESKRTTNNNTEINLFDFTFQDHRLGR